MNQIQGIDNTVKKLSALNKAMLLLVKIENNQFKNNEDVDVKQIIDKTLLNFENLIQAKNISIENKVLEHLTIKMNADLADVLIRNLIQNAVRHNFANGKIIVEADGKNLTISNTGSPLNISEADLFARFKKNEDSKESLGLGLAIVKSIVDVYNMDISYNYKNTLHTFIIKF